MARSRVTLSIDNTTKIMTIRYIGELGGEDVNNTMMLQLLDIPDAWTYDSIIDMRRFDGTIMTTEIEDLATRWNGLAQGRDAGTFTAIISDDALVRARLSITQGLFPTRTLANFNTLDEGLAWLRACRDEVARTPDSDLTV
ncbi:hypothetical protein [Asticcacaulis sp. 201]|uniref:hypothetical protein n=1 Tax=Asticcacaulis sp. 201 TaxID=3028787 RepID=UPI002916C166|nr:hypothetical protein [Asticcacaulis sp. 201]MDV6329550.1 hypothetical protein [Asticcacaulis sp. 201]